MIFLIHLLTVPAGIHQRQFRHMRNGIRDHSCLRNLAYNPLGSSLRLCQQRHLLLHWNRIPPFGILHSIPIPTTVQHVINA